VTATAERAQPPAATTTAPRPRRRRISDRDRRDYLTFLVLAAPNLLLIVAFTYRPLLSNIYYSTLNWTLGAATAVPVGLDNYVSFFTSPSSLAILQVTAIFTLATVGGSMLLGLLIALALNRRIRGRGWPARRCSPRSCSPGWASG